MNLQTDEFLPPPAPNNDAGRLRRVGFEFEFAGIDFDDVSNVLVTQLGGTPRAESVFETVVEDSRWGDVRLEVDASLLKERVYLGWLESLGLKLDADDTATLEEWIRDVSASVVPYEIVTPPIAIDALTPLDDLRRSLHEAGARGTTTSVFYGFGLHINAEAPSLTVQSLQAHTQAFLLLFDWIRQRSPTDITRRLSPFIDPFPDAYVEEVLRAQDDDLATFTDRYLQHNPTRNRALDLLPVLAHAAGAERVGDTVPGVSARPAYHYRLPDCRLSDPDWRISHAWNTWVAVERLASTPDMLADLCARRLQEGAAALSASLEKALADRWN